jgi:hypothetical protein
MRRLNTYYLLAERGMAKPQKPMISKKYGGAKRQLVVPL